MKKIKPDKSNYAKLASEYFLMEAGFPELFEDTHAQQSAQCYSDTRAMEDMLLMAETDDHSRAEIIARLKVDDFETDPKAFIAAFSRARHLPHGKYLAGYTASDFQNMKTFKVRGFDIGFALKDGDDIVSVFNGEKNVGGIGDDLLHAAIRVGGNRLDHYDGKLSAFYRRNGFKISSIAEWDDAYNTDNLKFPPIDITKNTADTVYANEYTHGPEFGSPEWKKKVEQYRNGKPDIIYRHL